MHLEVLSQELLRMSRQDERALRENARTAHIAGRGEVPRKLRGVARALRRPLASQQRQQFLRSCAAGRNPGAQCGDAAHAPSMLIRCVKSHWYTAGNITLCKMRCGSTST